MAGLLCARDLAAANRVARIDVEQAGPRRTVRIATDQAPVFATYTLDDAHQVVVDIAEGDLRHVAGPLEVRDGVLGDVSLQQFQTGPLMVSRVTVALSVLCSTVVQAEGNAIVVHACNGASDIPTESVLVASTEALGVEAFTALAQDAAALAALGPDLGDDAEAFAEGDADQREGRLAEAAYGAGDPTENSALGDDAAFDTDMPSEHAAALAAAPRPPYRAPARAPVQRTSRHVAQRAMAQAPQGATGMRGAQAARTARMALAAQRRNAARLAKNRAILAMAERRFARRAAARARAKQRLAIAAARPKRANKRAARRAALAMLAAQRTETAARASLASTVKTRAPSGDDADGDTASGAGPMLIRGRRFAAGGPPAALADASPAGAVADAEPPGPIVIQGRRFAPTAGRRAHRSSLVAVQRVEKSQILLRVQGGGRIKSRHLADPPRFVVDLGGIRRDTGEKFYALDTDLRASRVRLGDQVFGVRAVFDLRDHHTQARVRRTKDGILVAFSGRQAPSRARARKGQQVRMAPKAQQEAALQEEAMLDPQEEQDLQTQHDLQTAADLQAEQDAESSQAPHAHPDTPRPDLPALHPRGKSG